MAPQAMYLPSGLCTRTFLPHFQTCLKTATTNVWNLMLKCWRGYLSTARCKWFAYGLSDATATPSSLASLKSRLVTFCVSCRRREMYSGNTHLFVCVSVCLSAAAHPHYCMDPDVTWGSGTGCPRVVHYWADLQSVYGLRCYGSITRTQNVSENMLVLTLCLV